MEKLIPVVVVAVYQQESQVLFLVAQEAQVS
jgi:hypothetical protein